MGRVTVESGEQEDREDREDHGLLHLHGIVIKPNLTCEA